MVLCPDDHDVVKTRSQDLRLDPTNGNEGPKHMEHLMFSQGINMKLDRKWSRVVELVPTRDANAAGGDGYTLYATMLAPEPITSIQLYFNSFI